MGQLKSFTILGVSKKNKICKEGGVSKMAETTQVTALSGHQDKVAKHSHKQRIQKNWPFLLMLMVPLSFLFVFSFGPMYGVLIAFKDYSPGLGIWDSPWNNFEHFERMFSDFTFTRAFRNTIKISLLKLIFSFPAPIILALLLNEVKNLKYKKITQVISYLPYFMSWVIVASMLLEIFSPQRGLVNTIITYFGGDAIHFLSDEKWFVPILIGSDVWKEIGYGAIIYLAAITGVDPSLYEAAELDGASRFQKMWNVTLPTILPIILVMLLLRLGTVLNAGFDQILNLYNPKIYAVSDIIDTYVYRIGLVDFNLDYSTAVGLFKNLVGLILIVSANWFIKKTTNQKVL